MRYKNHIEPTACVQMLRVSLCSAKELVAHLYGDNRVSSRYPLLMCGLSSYIMKYGDNGGTTFSPLLSINAIFAILSHLIHHGIVIRLMAVYQMRGHTRRVLSS